MILMRTARRLCRNAVGSDDGFAGAFQVGTGIADVLEELLKGCGFHGNWMPDE
jgi:hypothetical protein